AALPHGMKALSLAEESGNATVRRASLANLGYCFYSLGEFDRAIDYFERAARTLPSSGDSNISRLETVARVRLSQGKFDECSALLDQIERALSSSEDRTLYGQRYAVFTRATFLGRRGRFREAVEQVEFAIQLAGRSHDARLRVWAFLTKAEFLL